MRWRYGGRRTKPEVWRRHQRGSRALSRSLQLLDALHRAMRERGCNAASLWTRASNKRAGRLYEGRGYHLTADVAKSTSIYTASRIRLMVNSERRSSPSAASFFRPPASRSITHNTAEISASRARSSRPRPGDGERRTRTTDSSPAPGMSFHTLAAARRGRRARRDRRTDMDRVEGRGAGLRRRVRDRAIDAIGRGLHLPLDDSRAVPQMLWHSGR